MSWETLREIARENREAEVRASATPPEACPIDGAVLEVNSRGVRNCPMGNYRWESGTGAVLRDAGVWSGWL